MALFDASILTLLAATGTRMLRRADRLFEQLAVGQPVLKPPDPPPPGHAMPRQTDRQAEAETGRALPPVSAHAPTQWGVWAPCEGTLTIPLTD